MAAVSGWIFTDARNFAECPHCKAKRGEVCRTPKGAEARYPHHDRVLTLQAHHPEVVAQAIRGNTREHALERATEAQVRARSALEAKYGVAIA